MIGYVCDVVDVVFFRKSGALSIELIYLSLAHPSHLGVALSKDTLREVMGDG